MAGMTFDQINQIINNGELAGATQAICNGINALATGAVRVVKTGTAEDLKGIVGEAKDTSDNTEKVLFSNIEDEAGLLLIVAIASLMGIQLHDNLKTANPELWQQLKALTQSRFFKTLIAKPQDIQQRVISSITEGLLDGPPCILTSTGDLYISGDILEMVFQSLQSVGAFDTGQTVYTLAELPIEDITAEGYHIGTWAEFVEFMNGEWASIKALLNAHQGTPYSEREYYDGREYVNAANSFTEYWANMRSIFANNTTAMQYMDSAENDTNRLLGYIVGIDDQQGYQPNGMLLILNVHIDFRALTVEEVTEANRRVMATGRHQYNYYGEIFALCKLYSYDYWAGYTAAPNCRSYITTTGGYGRVMISENIDQSIRATSLSDGGFNGYGTGAWFIYTSKSSGGDTPAGLNQEEGAELPSSDTASITSWISANLSAYDTTKLITDAPGSFNIPAHSQGWYKITIPYSSEYDVNLDGTEEAPSGGLTTQTITTTTSQEDENEAAGIEDTGTGTSTIINYYESKEGSEKETTGQEDSGEIEDEGVKELSWNAAGATGIYCPTDAEMGSISNWLWSTDFTDVIAQFFQDPAEALVSLQRCWLPFNTTGGQEVVFGRVGSGISVATANKFQSYTVPGSVTVSKFYNNYLDFEGQSSIYVPFAGFQNLDLRDIMEATLTLKYKWDLASGQGVAELWVARDDMNAPLYQWQINCNEQIPCSSANQAQYMLGVANMLTSTAIGTVGGFMAGGPLGGVVGGGVAAAAGIANMQGSQHVSQGGSIGGNAAAVACKTPFITIRYPKNNTPTGFNEFDGIGIDTVGTLGSFSGFVKCQEVHLLAGGGASKAELEAIEAILKEGVLL